MNWVNLKSLEEFDKILQLSQGLPVLIFKHSTRCSISSMALSRLEREWESDYSNPTYLIDLLNHRDLSNHIASYFKVIHQSPQIIIVKAGNSIYDASHSEIRFGNFSEFLT